ncbi:MAG: NAD(P)/FAD-dependent oxidoreductase [Mycobacterium sp.]
MGATGIVIVGGGLAAVRVCEQLRKSGDDRPITLVAAEDYPPYDRPPLSKEFLVDRAKTLADVALKPAEFYTEHRITVRSGSAARSLDTSAQTLTLEDGSTLGYDELIVATGLTPKRIGSWPDLTGIHVLRSLADATALRDHAATATRAVIVGAGFIGCEVAASLRALGVEVVLVEPQPTPLAGVLGEEVGRLVARLHRDAGVDVRTGTGVSEVRGERAVREVLLSDGEVVAADLVVLGIGSRPATAWLAGSGVDLDPGDGGVLCDAAGRTSAGHVWALGDVAAWTDAHGHRVRVEHWSNVADQARVLVAALLHQDAPAVVTVPYFWSDQYDVKIQCLGEPHPTDTVHVVEDDGRKFLANYEREGALAAVVGGGMPGKVMKTRAKIIAGTPIGEVL